jgi:hypothetical protein
MVAARIDQAYDERTAAKAAQVDRLTVGIDQAVIGERASDGRLAKFESGRLVERSVLRPSVPS